MSDKIILIIKYIIISLVQGIGEILPISSSAHLIIVQNILNIESKDLTFEIFLHLASLIAIIIFFYKKIYLIIKYFFIYILKKEKRNDEEIKYHFKLSHYLLIATLPAAIFGLFFKDLIEIYFSKMWVIGIFLLITSALLFISSKVNRTKELKDITYFDSFIIGISQCLGIIPGISRSGSTLYGSAIRKIKQEDAKEFTFLLAIPLMLGSAIISFNDLTICLNNKELFIPYIIAFIITLITTYLSLKYFLKFIKNKKLNYFAIYCLIIGILTIILGLTIYK